MKSMFKNMSVFTAGWDKPTLYVNTPPKYNILTVVFELQYKIPTLDEYGISSYTAGSCVNCGKKLDIVFLDRTGYQLAKLVWNARKVLIKEAPNLRNGRALYEHFKEDKSYGIQRLSELQKDGVQLGELIESYCLIRGDFGVRLKN